MGDGVTDRLGDLNGRGARIVIKKHNLLSETAGRRAEIESAGRNLGLAGEQFFRGESIKQSLERLAPINQLSRLSVCLAGFVISDPRHSGRMGSGQLTRGAECRKRGLRRRA